MIQCLDECSDCLLFFCTVNSLVFTKCVLLSVKMFEKQRWSVMK